MSIVKRTLKRPNPTTGKKVAYLVRVEGPRDAVTGKRRQYSKQVDTMKDARALEAQWHTEVERGTALAPDKTTIGQLLDRWLEVEVPRTVREENRVTYEIVIRKHLKPAFGHIPVRKLTVEAVETFYAGLQAAGYSSSLVKKCHMRLSAALRLAKRWGLVADNVCEVVKPPKLAYKQPDVWTPADVDDFLTVAELDGMHPYWLLAVETGARTSELLGVSWHDVDFERGTIRFGQQVVRLLKGTPIVKQDAKTEAGRRTIRLTAGILAELKVHRTRWLAKQVAAADWQNPHELVFCTASGRPINARHVRRSFDRLVKTAGVKPISPHGIRKTHITATVAAGANVKAVAARVGHRDVTTTLKTYTQLVPQMEDDLLEIVERLGARRLVSTAR